MTKPSASDELRQEWITPPGLYDGLHEQFHFNIDVAADVDNAKCLNFFSRTVNGLDSPWLGKRVWCNPPYKKVGPWVDKAIQEMGYSGATSVLLLPARTEQAWFRRVLNHATELSFFDARIQFLPPRGVQATSNREGSILAVFDPKATVCKETVRSAKDGRVLYTWQKELCIAPEVAA